MTFLRSALPVVLALMFAADAQAAPAPPAPAPSTAVKPSPSVAPPGSSADAQTLDRVAAVVNDEVVLESEVWDQINQVLLRANTRPDSAQVDTLRRQVLDNLVNMKLVYAEARRSGISVTEAEVDKLVSQAIDSKRQELGGDEGFAENLRRENITLDQLRQRYRDQIRVEEVSQRYVQKQVPRARVTVAEAEAYFKEHPDRFPQKSAEFHLAVIQIPVTADSVAEAAGRATAVAARKRILAGEKFAKVAAELSDDPGTARAGGDLGFFTRGTTVPEFEKAAFAQRIGVVGEPVRTPFGWHIIEVLERDTLQTRAHRDSLDAQGHPLAEAHVRHVLIRVDPTQKDADRIEALGRDVRDRAARGEDFAALARRYSRYVGDQGEGGDIGWVQVEGLSPNIRAALDSLKAGEISVPVPSPGQPVGVSVNIFKVFETRPTRPFTLEEVKEQLPEVVGRMKYNDRVDEWIKSLRTKAIIEIKTL